MTALEGDLPVFARAVLALGAVLALLLAARWVMARHGLAGTAAAPATGLRVVASLSLDPRNRVVIVRHGEAELILAVGPGGVTRLDVARAPDPVRPVAVACAP